MVYWCLLVALPLFICLRLNLRSDHPLKVLLLGLGISIYSTLPSHDYHTSLLSSGVVCYLWGSGSMALLLGSTFFGCSISSETAILMVSAVFVLVMTVVELLSPEFWELLTTPLFIASLLTVLLSLLLLYALDSFLTFKDESSRRKLFHAGPILICPFLYWINPPILVLDLSIGFTMFLVF